MFRLILLALSALALNAQLQPGRPGTPVQKCLLDLAIVIDASGSIYADQADPVQGLMNWQAVQKFTADLVLDFIMNGGQDTHIASVVFEDKAQTRLLFNLGELTTAEMESILRNLPYDLTGGRTRLDVAMEILLNQVYLDSNPGNRPNAPDVVIVLTDGNVTKEYEARAFQLIDQLKAQGVLFMAIGVTDMVNIGQLNRIASNGFFFTVDQFVELETILMEIQNQACIIIQPQTTTTTSGPPSCPTPNLHIISFSAYMSSTGMMHFTNQLIIPFQATVLNIGGHFSTVTSQFTCPCEGIYEFHLTMSYVSAGVAAAIVQNTQVVSPLAYSGDYPGAMSTTTIIKCYPGDTVYAQIILHSYGLVPCLYNGNSFYGFTGKLLYG